MISDMIEAIKAANDAIEKLNLAEINQLMATVRMEAAKLAEENAALRDDNRALREAARLRESMTFRDDAYWMNVDGNEQGPYCPKCWDGNQKPVRLIGAGENYWGSCSVCVTTVYKPEARARQRRGGPSRSGWNVRG